MHRKTTIKVFSLLLIMGMIFSMLQATTPTAAKSVSEQSLEKVESKVLETISTEGASDYVVEMKEKADLSKAYNIKDWSERGWYVYNTLREIAARTQKPVLEVLEKQGVKYDSFYAGNEIAVYGSGINVLSEIAALSGVEHIRFPRTAYIEPGFASLKEATVLQSSVNALDWGITDTNADDFWSTFGMQGDGLVVANIDTGVQWDHPALDQAFKCGTDPSNAACWADPANVCGGSACDNNGHGTHTMGTMVGDDDPTLTYQVGMAPNAQWIACKGCETNSCSDTSLNACADWILAPAGSPDNRPHVVNNSWGGGGGDAWYLPKVNAWRAAAIFPAFSAGNSGPTCGSIGSPSDYQESFSTANHTSTRTISSSSSRGPSTYGDDPYTKPNISAPGTSICSSIPGSSWSCGYSGTSMAAPHVAGAVALLWSCNASLIGDMTATFEVLQDTADPSNDGGNCGAPTDGEGNFTYGYGYLNVLAAGQQVCAAGTIAGTVTNGTTPIEGATVTADNGAGLVVDVLTLADGTYTLNVPEDTYDVSATKYGYTEDIETGVVVTEGSTTTVNFVITPLSTSMVSGYVYDGGVTGLGSHGYPLYSAIHITATGFDETIYTDPFTGYYEVELMEDTAHTFTTTPVPGGYDPLVESVIPTGASYTHDIYVPVDGEVCAAPGYQPDYDFFFSFEGSDEGFTPGGTTSFAWGDFTSGPMAGHSGTKGIATNPAGNYNASELGWMASPVLDMSGFGTDSIAIQWWDWKHIESASYDWARLDVTKDGGVTWNTVWGPIGGVSDTAYNQQTVTLDPTYNVSNFQMRFYFKSDSSVQYEGWYVDDIGIVAVPVPPPTTVFSTDFDTDNGGFTVSGTTTWAWGAPTSGPGAPYSVPNVWATNLTGNYNNSESGWITSPVIDLSAHTGLAPTISFWHWNDIESTSFDWGVLEVSKDGGTTWTDVSGKIGDQLSWAPKSYQLDPTYAVSNFQFRFYFRSDSSVAYPGWYIDDVVVTMAEPVVVAAPCVIVPGGVVAGYVFDDNDDSPLVGADVYSDLVETQTFFIPDDPESEGLFWVFHPVMGPGKGVQSLSGTNVAFDPTAGGAAGYTPGVPTTLCFESNIYSPDWEYVNHTWLKFPTDWTISSTYLMGTPTCDYGIWPYAPEFYWETEPYEVVIYHVAATNSGGDHCVAEYCVDVTPGASAGLVSWYYDGDNFGSSPHHPCSSDVYTPGSMADYPCDEWSNPQASIPMIGGEAHDFTAEKDQYGSDTETVFVVPDFIVQQDFYLGTGELSFAPTFMEVTMTMGDTPHDETLTISNLGTSDAMFELVEKDGGFVSPLSIPAFTGKLPEDTRPVSIGPAPKAAPALQLSGNKSPLSGILLGEPAFAVDLTADALKYIPDTTLPGVWTNIGATMTSLFAGDFLAGDFTTLYAISYDNNNLYTVDVATGAYTLVGPSTPPTGQSWTGLTGTPDGTLYGLTTDIATSNLVTVNPDTGAVTVLGPLSGLAGGIDLAYNTDDDMIYIVDLITDSLFRVDPDTLATTLVGALGVSANYAQGMDYEEESGVLYWAAYTTAGELRIIDTITGASSLVGAFPGGAETDCLAFTTGGQSDVPWLSEDSVSGTVTPTTPVNVTVTFDPTGAGLNQPGDYLAELKVKHDTPYTYPNIPVTLHLLASSTYGTFNGTVTGLEACDINPAPLEGAEVNFWQGTTIIGSTTTNAAGYYSFALPAGTYDIEFIMDGYVTDYAEEVVLPATETITVDMELRLDAPCLSVMPVELEQTQPTDTVTTQTLTIVNTGAAAGDIELFELPVSGLLVDQLLQDPSFELYTPNPYWDEYSAAFGTPLCTVADCGTGTGTGPNTGDVWSWFGGTSSGDTGYVSQDVMILPGTANMTFFVEQTVCGDGGASNYMALKIDGVELWRTDGLDPACGILGYRLIEVDVSDYADGNTHEIKFDSVTIGNGNFFVDDVELNLEPGADVPWLSEDPIAGTVPADSSLDITITYDSTGLAEGDYLATIRVKNPPAPAIDVPVTLHVTGMWKIFLPLLFK